MAFGQHYRQTASPFQWTSTRADLERVLERGDAHKHNRGQAHLGLVA